MMCPRSGRKLLRSDQFDTLLADVIDHLYDGNHDHPEIGSSFLIAIFSSIHFMNTISAFTLNDLVDRVVEPIATRAGPVPAHVLHVLLALGPWRRAAARLAPRLAVLAPDLTDPDRGALIAQLFALVAERAAPYPPLAGNPLWAALSASSANSDDDDDDTDDDSGADVEGQYGRLQRLTERARDAAFAERLLLRRRRSACLCEEDLIEFGRTYRTRLIVADHEVIGIETDDERHDVDDDLIRVRYELVQQLQRRRCRWRSVARDPIRARSLVDLVTEAICHAGAADHPDPILFGNGAAGYEQRLANEFANVCDTLGVIVDHDQFRCFHRMCSTNADHDDDDRSQDHRWRLDRVAVHVLALAAHCTARTGGEPVALARALAARLAASKLGSGSGLASFAARLERIVATLLADIDFMLRRSSIDCQQLAEIWVWSGFQTGPCLRPWLLLAPVTDAGAVFADLVGRLQAGRRHLRRRWAMIGCLTLDDVVDVMSASEPAIDDLERIRARIQSWARTESG